VRRLILSPRWIVWHVLTLGAMVTCGWLAAWQWERAGSAMGSALNVGYGLQWPLFAVFFGVMWWRMLRMEAAKLEEAAAEGAQAAEEPPAEEPAEAPVPQPRTAAPPDAPSPFGPRPRDAAPPPADDDPELAAYNRMLAELAARNTDR
jgi:DNA-binding transcriptional regulator of glucitol operon